MELLLLFQDSISGVIRPFDPRIKLLGAVNRDKVTCYLDALLFSMFLRNTVFEAMLYHNFREEERKKLVTILRLWVNMLRTGRLITTDITHKLQETLAECGWSEASRLRQQDASEAFGLITDKLELPLLTLKTDLFHQGKHDKDDHKFITERLLEVALPEGTPSDASVTLETCLEDYFNNKVEVKRELQRRNTLTEIVKNDVAKTSSEKDTATHIETKEVDPRAESPALPDTASRVPPMRLSSRDRATSIFSERRVNVIEGKEANEKEPRDGPPQLGTLRKASTIRKEVAMPAWQFLNLIPWYTDNASEAETQVKAHFASRRPMLGICLKRYTISSDGIPTRLGTRIDIPLEMSPPLFAVDERQGQDESVIPRLKLVLQAVVCHRGTHVNSGHYVALVRTPASVIGYDGPDTSIDRYRDPRQCQWLRHDDLAVNNRVTDVDIQQALKDESPYLLFYQVLPLEDEDSSLDEPPPYEESMRGSFNTVEEKLARLQSPGRPSLDATEFNSRRASIATSDEARSQVGSMGPRGHASPDAKPPSFVRQDSGGITDSASVFERTRPTTPHDDLTLTTSGETKRSKTKSTRKSRPSNDVGKRMGEFVSRFGGSGSREKVDMPEAVGPEDEPNNTIPKDTERVSEQPLPVNYKVRSKEKDKEKKKHSKSKSRRSSAPLGKLPERECRVM